MDREDFEPSPLADVELPARTDDRWTLVFVRDLRHPPERVWAALTEPAQLGEWAPFLADRDLGTLGDAVLTMVDGDTAEAIACDGGSGRAAVAARVHLGRRPAPLGARVAIATGTRLTLRHTLPQREMVPMVTAGWHICLDVAELLLDGVRSGRSAVPRRATSAGTTCARHTPRSWTFPTRTEDATASSEPQVSAKGSARLWSVGGAAACPPSAVPLTSRHVPRWP